MNSNVAELIRVSDDRNAELRLDLGLEITERLPFKGIQAPEIFGVPTAGPEYQRRMEAKRYVERRRCPVVRAVFDIDRDLRDELTVRANAEHKTPAQLLRTNVERFLTEWSVMCQRSGMVAYFGAGSVARGVIVIYWMTAILGVTMTRFGFRGLRSYMSPKADASTPVAVYGASTKLRLSSWLVGHEDNL